MTASDIPRWLQTAQEKRRLRDEAIQKFTSTHEVRSIHRVTQNGNELKKLQPTAETFLPVPTRLENIDGILQAIRSGAVTATRLCTDYIYR
jgi:hypothetical protein